MSRKLTFWSVFALVTGSQIGSGIFMLPASLAPFGALSLAGWLISGIGAVMLALVFAALCTRFPRTGGPHAYVQEAFGPSCGFFTGWTYWVISWVSTTAVITASVGYLTPLLGDIPSYIKLILEVALLVAITAINFKGVQTAGRVEFFLTALKTIPLLLVPFIALFFFNKENFASMSIVDSASQDLSSILKNVTMLTLWGFIGLESGTTPAGSVENPTKTIPRAVVLGTLFVAVLYFFNSLGIMGALPANELITSTAPYADAARFMFAGNWHLMISLIAAIVCIGTLNAWILASGQIALGLAQDKLMPEIFSKKNRHGAPFWALLVSSIGILPLLFLTQNETLAKQINVIIDFSVICFLFVYAFCCLAHLKLLWTQKDKTTLLPWLYTFAALIFCGWIISATPLKTLFIASLFVLSGIPVFLFQKRKINFLSEKPLPEKILANTLA
ncbi:MAG: amino acid permease [Gammaproteobacteria bacterium 39-13]|nr:amino acid permease [Gammaproteobacteria bacterium]OJV90723.1 MAG: amino acid permease [Gammaproteobacteria bacterium 39-13]